MRSQELLQGPPAQDWLANIAKAQQYPLGGKFQGVEEKIDACVAMLPASLETNIVGKNDFEEVIKKLEEIKSNKNAESNTSMEIFPPTPSSASSDRDDSGKSVDK